VIWERKRLSEFPFFCSKSNFNVLTLRNTFRS